MWDEAAYVRACLYFTLWELCGRNTREVSILWPSVRETAPRKLRSLDAASMFSSLGFPEGKSRDAFDKVVSAMKAYLDWTRDAILERGSLGYPRLLGQLSDAPQFLFVRGDAGLLDRPALAIVGTRNPSREGASRAFKLACLLAERGIVVVSGLAKGIDTAAHRGALSVGCDTIAVLGTPLHMYYPRENAVLQKTIEQAGLVLTEFYPGAGIRRCHFPMRNATMSGLCLGTVVIEASETSGALIQARQCLRQGRKLFIPRSAVENERLTWPKAYLQRGAHQFATLEDLMRVLSEENLLPPKGDGSMKRPVRAEIFTFA